MATVKPHASGGTIGTPAPPPHVVLRWLAVQTAPVGRHALSLFSENAGSRAGVLGELRDLFREHYVAPDVTAVRLAELGAPRTAELLREHLPLTKKARSGDAGEILATEIAECHLAYTVPVRRLRWKDGRNMALRGDDVLGLARAPQGHLRFLKGESKSRAALAASVVTDAGTALDRDRGRPTRHSVLFVAERLREQGQDALALELENAVLNGFAGCPVEHLLFTVSGNDPTQILTDHLRGCASKKRVRRVVGLRVPDHAKFIETLYSGM